MTSNENRRILVIDDNPSIHTDFHKMLGGDGADTASLDAKESALFGDTPKRQQLKGYRIDSAYQGADGLGMIQQARHEGEPYVMAFVDVRMPPGLDGIETIERAKNVDPELQFVICTAYSDYGLEDVIDRLGEMDRLLFLRKPFEAITAHLLTIALSEKWRLNRKLVGVVEHQNNCIVSLERVVQLIEEENAELESSKTELENQSTELSDRLQQRTIEILGTRDVTVMALAQLAESRDPETGDHLYRMREYAQLLATTLSHHGPYADQIDADFLDNFYRSTPLHDIGKVGIPDQVLLKPGRLTTDEFEIMKRHTLIGAEALEKAAFHSPYGTFLRMAAEIARYHHERWDGTGYPIGLSGDQIPLAARITAVADVFDALTMNRVYKDAMPTDEARQLMKADAGEHFDPVIIDAFDDCFNAFLDVKCQVDGMVGATVETLV